MILKSIKNFINNNKPFIVILFLLLILASLFPYTSDDWAWGSSYGIEQLESLFQDMNGRYMGNMLVIILTRYKILKTIIVATTILFTSVLISKIVNNKKYIYLSLLLFFMMPINIFSTTIVWTSGFVNYGFTSLFFLYFIYINRDINIEEEKVTKKRLIILFILSVMSGLFMENLTLYFLMTSLLLTIYYYIKYKKISIYNTFYFVGALISTIIMFSNQAYKGIVIGTDFYRDVHNNLFIGMIVNYFKIIARNAIQYNMFLNIILLLLFSVLVYNNINKNSDKKNNYNNNLKLLLTIIFSYVLYNLLKLTNVDFKPFLKFTTLFDGLFAFFYYLALILIPLLTIKDKRVKERLIFYWLSNIILIVPLLFVSPVSTRNFLLSYILIILFILEILNYLINLYSFKLNNRILLTVASILLFYYISIYVPIFYWDKVRTNHVKSEIKLEKKEIKIPKLPNGSALFGSEPDQKEAFIFYKWYYNISDDVLIKVIPLDEWKKERIK